MSNLLRLSACLTILLSFNAFAVDTDGDGFSDADEATLGTDPNDPTSPLENKLTASDGEMYDYFGTSVSIDGDTAMIGAHLDDDNGEASGSVYVIVRDNGVWAEQQKLTASDGASKDRFGVSVSIDGDTAVIGASGDDDPYSGSAYVFTRNNGVWSEQQKLTASDTAQYDHFGESVSINGDTAFIGASGDDDNGNGSGSVYVFVRNDGVWSEQQKLTASDGNALDHFGTNVSIDGDTAVIGARLDDDNGSASGSVYVYVRSNGVWSEQQKLTARDGASNDRFGVSVSINGDTAVIGSYYDDNGTDSGSAYVYVRNNGVWSEQQKLTASDGAEYDYFGTNVSIDGDTAIIGAHSDDDNGPYSGSAYVYVRSNGVWSEQQKLTARDGASNDYFGTNVSIDGDTAVIGAQDDGDNGSSSGSAYVFPLTPPSPPHQDTPAVITGSLDGNTTQGGFTFGSLQATDVDGLTDGTYFTVSNAPLYGQAQINPSTGLWTYLAGAVYVGADPFTVTVTDDLGGTTEQVVSITITAPDSDGDGTYDFQDNCPSVSNADQANLDGDTFGDACDSDIDGDGVDNTLDAFPNDATESSDSDSDNVGDNSDNCMNDANFDQSDIDSDTVGDACDPDMDGDGVFNVVELRFGGDETDNTDAGISQDNIVTFSETAPADSDLDGVPDDYETAAGGDTTSSTFESVLAMLTTAKNVPAMGGIGLLALGLSMLGLGAVRMKRK